MFRSPALKAVKRSASHCHRYAADSASDSHNACDNPLYPLSKHLMRSNPRVMPICFLIAVAVFVASPLAAQQRDFGTVDVTVRESMGMIEGFLVSAGTRRATTDSSGRASLGLRAGQHTLIVTRIGFVPKRLPITVIADSTIVVVVEVSMEDHMAAMEDVTISATRTGVSPHRLRCASRFSMKWKSTRTR